jgi:hypothetical protein
MAGALAEAVLAINRRDIAGTAARLCIVKNPP